MQSFRLKNIIILILTLLNLFLLGSLVTRRCAERAVRDRATQQLVALFAADGITLDPDLIPREAPPSGGTLEEDLELDQQVATRFLDGDLTRADQGGGIYTYTSSHGGTAAFRPGGSFDIACRQESPEAAQSLFQSFCRSFLYGDPQLRTNQDGSRSGSAVRRFDGYPVLNCTVSFNVDADGVMSVSGTHLSQRFTPDQGPAPLSAPAALTAFLENRRELSAVISAVTEILPCYELQSTSAAPMALVPAWCIRTDTSSYYVNCYTGAVSHS